MTILNGTKIAKRIKAGLAQTIKKQRLMPGLAVILVGRDPGSLVYIKLKEKAAGQLGIKFKKFTLPAKTSQKKLTTLIQKLNRTRSVHGIIVQLPLPGHLKPVNIIAAINPRKDVDGFRSGSAFIPPAHQAVLKLLEATGKNLKGKIAVILAKNPVFANPLSNLLKKRGIKVSVEVSPPQTKKADILIVALGRPNFIKPEMVKKNSIIIDVGYTRANGRPMGDVSPEVVEKTGYLSPVPGGVGPLTVAYLLKNVYLSAKRALQNSKK